VDTQHVISNLVDVSYFADFGSNAYPPRQTRDLSILYIILVLAKLG
jgi:hypothetical protein